MKKRKELDALVSNGKLGKRTKKNSGSGSAHELLRHDSETSDMEDFSILQPRRNCKKGGSPLRLCAACLPLCLFVLVTACVVASATLVWLHLGLREDLDLMRAHLQKVEAGNKNTPEAFHTIHTQLKNLQNNVTSLGLELKKITGDIASITAEVKHLKQTTNNIEESIAAAPEIKLLPKDVSSLSENVASIGSKITALEATVKELKDQQSTFQSSSTSLNGELDALKATVQDIWNTTETQQKLFLPQQEATRYHELADTKQMVANMQEKLHSVSDSMDRINHSFTSQLLQSSTKFDVMNSSVTWLVENLHLCHDQINAIENYTHSNLSERLDVLESNKKQKSQQISNINRTLVQQMTKQMISQALTDNINSSLPSLDTLDNVTWKNLLQHANQMVILYADLVNQMNTSSRIKQLQEKNATTAGINILNYTFTNIFQQLERKVKDAQNAVDHLSTLHVNLQQDLTVTESKVNTALDLLHQIEQHIFGSSNISEPSGHEESTHGSLIHNMSSTSTVIPAYSTSSKKNNPTRSKRNHDPF